MINDNIIIPAKAQDKAIKVLLLADEGNDTKYMDYVTRMAAAIISAAGEDRMAVMVCKHADSDKRSVVLCSTEISADGTSIGYVPLAQMFDQTWAPWQEMTPPDCALPSDDSAA